jgi:hypothetical protein
LKQNFGSQYFTKQYSKENTNTENKNLNSNSDSTPIFIHKSETVIGRPGISSKSEVELETPVIRKRSSVENKTLDNQEEFSDKFETPTFIHKKEASSENSNISKNIHSSAQILHEGSDIKDDINKLISQLDNSKDKAERSRVCK